MLYPAASLLLSGVLSIAASAGPAESVERAASKTNTAPAQIEQRDTAWQKWMQGLKDNDPQAQVRIERRITIRIPRSNRSRLPLSSISQAQLSSEWKERKIGKCLSMRSIAGMQVAADNQLLLYTRDRRIIRARLQKTCRAKDFYSGFYLEKSSDGRLCVSRDVLQSRSGARCELERIRQMVPDDD